MKILETIKAKRHYGWVIFALTLVNLSIEGGASNAPSTLDSTIKNATVNRPLADAENENFVI